MRVSSIPPIAAGTFFTSMMMSTTIAAIATTISWGPLMRKRITRLTAETLPWYLRLYGVMVGATIPGEHHKSGSLRGIPRDERFGQWTMADLCFLAMTGKKPTPEEARALQGIKYYADWDSGYSKQQSTRPQTLGYGLTDSPSGQAAWILEKFWAWTDCDGHPENILSRDELLDNVMLYWVTATAASSERSPTIQRRAASPKIVRPTAKPRTSSCRAARAKLAVSSAAGASRPSTTMRSGLTWRSGGEVARALVVVLQEVR